MHATGRRECAQVNGDREKDSKPRFLAQGGTILPGQTARVKTCSRDWGLLLLGMLRMKRGAGQHLDFAYRFAFPKFIPVVERSERAAVHAIDIESSV